MPIDPMWPSLVAEVTEVDSEQPDVVVALGLTHDVTKDVRSYVAAKLSGVRQILTLRPASGSGAQSVACGRHAFELAQAAIAAIRVATSDRPGMTHLFVAAPNTFTFFLGQRQPILGRVRLYEFDFEGGRDRSYKPALTLPFAGLQVTTANPAIGA